MNVIVITIVASTGNIVRGALQAAKASEIEAVVLPDALSVGEHLEEETVVLVDWEGSDPVVHAETVKRVKSTPGGEDTPVLLLSTKQAAGTTFAGMKAGASGLVSKPIDPQDLVKKIATALKHRKMKRAQSINVEFINPFIEATRTVFQTMAGIAVERKRLFLKNDYQMLGDISGVMGLSGSASGSVVISLPTRLAIEMVSKMLGEAPGETLTPEVSDGVGEIINMISGQAKASLAKTKYHFQISIPTVVMGEHHEITHRQGTPNIVVLFESEAGDTFAIQVCLCPEEE